jgi:hypothetical protein
MAIATTDLHPDGQTVLDANDEQVGTVQDAYCEPGGAAHWLLLNGAVAGIRTCLVPLHAADMVDGAVRLGYERGRLEGAPRVDVDPQGALDEGEEARLYQYYSLPHPNLQGGGASPRIPPPNELERLAT